jgi:hypothetical protein
MPPIFSLCPGFAAMEMSDAPVEAKTAPLWLKIIAGAFLLLAYWMCLLFTSVAALPSAAFPKFQTPVMLVAALPAGLLPG